MSPRARVPRGLAAAVTAALALALVSAAPASAGPDTTTSPSSTTTLSASALVDWHLAPSLTALRTEIDTRWPNRDRSSDGAIGDIRHQTRTNSHNPARYPGGPSVGTVGSVHALDITARGIDVNLVLDAVVGDPRVWYVIHDGQIWSRTTGWSPRRQSGDPHVTHIHINLREDSQSASVSAEQDTSRWLGGSGSRGASAPSRASAAALPTSVTKSLQRALISRGFTIPSGPTGWYGPETTRAVAAFQRSQGWAGSGADGIAGALTLKRLGLASASTAATRVSTTTDAPSRTTTRASAKASTAKGASPKAYRPGTATREVYFLQQALIERGYRIPAGPTGYYGSKTVEAVRAFQLAQGWPEAQCDGIPGTKTLKLLGLA
jgi:peptidoglycan hydrolase-like protein with peptidoglycan-binding domain